MSAAVRLVEDFAADDPRRRVKLSRDAGPSRRLLAPATIYDGASRTEAARIGAVGLPTVRDWVLAFNAQGSKVHEAISGGQDPGVLVGEVALCPDRRAAVLAAQGGPYQRMPKDAPGPRSSSRLGGSAASASSAALAPRIVFSRRTLSATQFGVWTPA